RCRSISFQRPDGEWMSFVHLQPLHFLEYMFGSMAQYTPSLLPAAASAADPKEHINRPDHVSAIIFDNVPRNILKERICLPHNIPPPNVFYNCCGNILEAPLSLGTHILRGKRALSSREQMPLSERHQPRKTY
ncbi:hypothetical protein L5D93_00005, partial [Paenibacillus thiaminolyticus]|nr:hypothetical protein [Paenibacillus thiaminolyticus]